jgi:hypothetical protein
LVRCACLLLIIAITGCNYNKRELPQPSMPIDSALLVSCDTLDVITYTNLVKSILETNCTLSDCHDINAPPGLDYTTYAGIKAKADNGKIQERVLNLKNMPPSNTTGPASLDSCTLVRLQEWLNNGAPE